MSEYCCTCGGLVPPSHFDLNLNHEQREEKSMISDEQIEKERERLAPFEAKTAPEAWLIDHIEELKRELAEAKIQIFKYRQAWRHANNAAAAARPYLTENSNALKEVDRLLDLADAALSRQEG